MGSKDAMMFLVREMPEGQPVSKEDRAKCVEVKGRSAKQT